ncbi:hypothetical protein GOY07_00590 [Wolbachia endosymbiont of Litomosoides sigmodontis]|uniref:hypothetical protein n=1 Tax=Wolbachia endosymbiont of Litomosoides sigmodontis TaxID=80850 RepID=UPI00158AAF7B|nr:hypothetical protein GOY07_00590 [Wolbachia endosymbiont of Litomosoides sigmodontis]
MKIGIVHKKNIKDSSQILVTKMNSVPIDVVLIIHLSINIDISEMLIETYPPTLSRSEVYTKDSNIKCIAQQNQIKLNSNIPIIEIREMNPMVKD